VASWLVKAAVQGAVSRLPQAHRLNGLLQRYVTRSLELDEARFMKKWRQAQRHLRAHYLHGGRAPALDTVIELGTGWYPIVPLGLALSGARRVLSFDLVPLLDPARVLGTLKMYRRLAHAGRLPALEPDACDRIDEVLARAAGRSAQWLLEAFGVCVRRADARRTGLPEGSVDLFVSNNTLEHVPGDVLSGVFREFHRVGHEGSVMSHFIDMADHYAGFDPSITVFNYLKYSSRTWALFNNRLQFQSRLRLPDYRALHRETRWLILEEDLHAEPAALLRQVELAQEFRALDEEALRVTEAWITSGPAPDHTH
jgi:hypothetical protein